MANTYVDGLDDEIRRQPISGLTNRDLARMFGCSERTVTNHKRRLEQLDATLGGETAAGTAPVSAPRHKSLAGEFLDGRGGPPKLRSLLDAFPRTSKKGPGSPISRSRCMFVLDLGAIWEYS
jgi:hypothetical protein